MYEVRATKLENENSNVIGLASMVVDSKFAFNSIRIIKSDNVERGFFVSMPSYKKKDGTYVDLFHPVTSDMTNALCSAIQKSLELGGEVVTIGAEPSQITTRVSSVNYDSQVGKVTLYAGDMVCDSIALRKSAEDKLFISYPSYPTKKVDENGNTIRSNYCNPISADFRTQLNESIINQYTANQNKKYAISVDSRKVTTYSAEIDLPSVSETKNTPSQR